MKTFASLAQWCAGAAEALGDPAAAVCQAFFQWQDPPKAACPELVCGVLDGELVVYLGPLLPLPIPVQIGEATIGDDGVEAYGIEQITPGVWAITPSLNVEGVVHAFVVLYGVPDPAPWERRIVVASSIQEALA